MHSMSLSDRRPNKTQPSKVFRMDYLPSLPLKGVPKEKALMHASNKKIFIGPSYQAELPPLQTRPPDDYYSHVHRRHEIPLWRPTDRFTPDKLTALLGELKSKGFDEDQVLAFLLFQNYNLDATLVALNNDYVGKQEGMPLHDKVLFVQGYGFHGKNFERIRDLVPNHSIQTLINHYYTEFKRNKANNKLTTTRTETDVRKLSNAQLLADKQPPSQAVLERKAMGRPRILRDNPLSTGPTDVTEETADAGPLLYLRARQGEAEEDAVALDDPEEVDESWEGQERRLQQQLDEEKIRMEQLDQQLVQLLQEEAEQRPGPEAPLDAAGLQDAVIGEARGEAQKEPTPVWHAEEMKLFMRALVEYGKDFGRASRLLPNKTEQQVRNMFYNRGHFYRLDTLIRFHEEKEALAASKKT